MIFPIGRCQIEFDTKHNPALRIAVINGGQSAEAAVSRVSAQGVIGALKANYQHVEAIELDATVAEKLKHFAPDVVFPVLHGPPGEDGTLQGFLEILEYKYVGSGVQASAVAMDKILAKQVFRRANLPLADEIVFDAQTDRAIAVAAIIERLGSFVVVKPASQGSALGVTLVENENELDAAMKFAAELGSKILVESRISGKEITVGVIDTDDGPVAHPVIEITTAADSWYDFEHRYTAGLSDHIIPARLPDAQLARLQKIAIDAHVSLQCRDLSRADFVVPNESEEYLLEVNTLPGMTPTSLYPDGASALGLSFEDLVSFLVERAASR
ncbi:MAG: D-alanine--D-alanine ligase [Pseudomonadales bacterium]